MIVILTADAQERLEAAHLNALAEAGWQDGGRFDIDAMVMARYGSQLLLTLLYFHLFK